jgi:CRP-like cAMP-binding protein
VILHAFVRTHVCRYLSEEEAHALMDSGRLRRLAQGEVLFNSGERGDSLFVILQGRIHVYQPLPEGAIQSMVVLGYGSIIGEVSLVDRQDRSASAAALDDAALFELTRAQMVELIRAKPALAAKVLWSIMETLTVRLRDVTLNVQTLLSEKLKDVPRTEI